MDLFLEIEVCRLEVELLFPLTWELSVVDIQDQERDKLDMELMDQMEE